LRAKARAVRLRKATKLMRSIGARHRMQKLQERQLTDASWSSFAYFLLLLRRS